MGIANTLLARSGNQAVDINPPHGLDLHITEHGSDWLWAAFSVFALVMLIMVGLSYLTRPQPERIFFYNAIFSTFVMTVLYFTMASNLGWTGIQAEFNHATVSNSSETPGIRQIWYARYVGWFLAFPTLLFNFAIAAGLTWPTTLFTIVTQEVFVVCLLIGSLIHSSYKWGYFTFAVVAYLLIAFNLIYAYGRAALALETVRYVSPHNGALVGLLFIYPIAWALSEGGNVIQPDSEMIFYGILDVCTFVLLQGAFVAMSRSIDFVRLGFHYPTHPVFTDKEIGTSNRVSQYSAATAVEPSPTTAAVPSSAPVEPVEPAPTAV